MAITVLQSPDPIALTKGGRLQYIFSGNGRLVNTGVLAVNFIFLAGAVVPGQTFTLSWKGKTLKMVARANPVHPYEFPAGDGSNAYIASILPYFRDYFPIESDFVVEAMLAEGLFHGLTFTARKPGPEYNFAAVGGAPAFYAIANGTPGVAPTYRNRYSVYVEVHCQRDADPDYAMIYSGALELNEQGRAEFDLSTTLHSHLSPDLPHWRTAVAKPAENSAASYYIRYAEAWGEPLEPARITKLEPLRVYWGGMPYEQQGRLQLDKLVMPSDDDAAQDKLLRNGPALRYVRPDECQYLTYLNLREDRLQVGLSIAVTLDNGQKASYNNRVPALDIAQNEKVIFPAGLPQLKLPIAQGRQVREYTLRIVHEGGFLSQPYRFVVNQQYQPHVRYFAFISSLGAPDTMSTFGKGSSELALFREEAERVLPQHYELSDGQFVEYNTGYQQQFEVATGWRSQSELRQLNDFYRADRRWLLLADRELPIGVTAKSIKQAKDGDTAFAHKFDYVFLFKDEFYFDTEEGDPLPPLNFRPAGSVTITPVTTTSNYDRTVPDVVRNIKPDDITNWNEAASRPDPSAAGYLTQQSAAPLFSPLKHTHTWNEIQGKPDLEGMFVPQDIEVIMPNHPVGSELELELEMNNRRFSIGDVLLGRNVIFSRFQ
ncbi:hypothetical protein ACFQ4C_18085 [Larkinella insperata]|uniref:Uncharacterized protein n=1 Tax=Larkinella insperata TaxID=332158 RepID=A0ABW3Q738_9BACT|nr:hypothetical protein [Larkinella insperata]